MNSYWFSGWQVKSSFASRAPPLIMCPPLLAEVSPSSCYITTENNNDIAANRKNYNELSTPESIWSHKCQYLFKKRKIWPSNQILIFSYSLLVVLMVYFFPRHQGCIKIRLTFKVELYLKGESYALCPSLSPFSSFGIFFVGGGWNQVPTPTCSWIT